MRENREQLQLATKIMKQKSNSRELVRANLNVREKNKKRKNTVG
jgi:hypothetical protein